MTTRITISPDVVEALTGLRGGRGRLRGFIDGDHVLVAQVRAGLPEPDDLGIYDDRIDPAQPTPRLLLIIFPGTGAIQSCFYHGVPVNHRVGAAAPVRPPVPAPLNPERSPNPARPPPLLPNTFFRLHTVHIPAPEPVEAHADALPDPLLVIVPLPFWRKLASHAEHDPENEAFGLMIGRVTQSPDGRVRILLTDCFPARPTVSNRVFVEVSAEELTALHDVFEQQAHRYAADKVLKVGWYHTHPGHGIFMSATDRANHRLYPSGWHIALVVDPVQHHMGFFGGRECDPVPFLLSEASGDCYRIARYRTLSWPAAPPPVLPPHSAPLPPPAPLPPSPPQSAPPAPPATEEVIRKITDILERDYNITRKPEPGDG